MKQKEEQSSSKTGKLNILMAQPNMTEGIPWQPPHYLYTSPPPSSALVFHHHRHRSNFHLNLRSLFFHQYHHQKKSHWPHFQLFSREDEVSVITDCMSYFGTHLWRHARFHVVIVENAYFGFNEAFIGDRIFKNEDFPQ